MIVVVDDLDRCDARTVAEALAAIRQFTPDELEETREFGCQFLVPCDENQVVLALELAGHDVGEGGGRSHDYKNEELLRKFFDASVRMQMLLPTDLSEYAASLAKSIDLDPQDARELVALARPNDPRLVKALLNSLQLSRARTWEARREGVYPDPSGLPDWARTERLLVALCETDPELHTAVCRDPGILEECMDAASAEKGDLSSGPNLQKLRIMVKMVGGVSVAAAQTLLFARLPQELRGLSQAGMLAHAFQGNEPAVLWDAIAKTEDARHEDVAAWLSRVVQEDDTEAGLRRRLDLILGFPDASLIAVVAPALDSAIAKPMRLLQEVLSNHGKLHRIEEVLDAIELANEQKLYAAVLTNLSSRAEEEWHQRELALLLACCKRLDQSSATQLRQWLASTLLPDDAKDATRARVADCLPADSGKCAGFDPDLATELATLPAWGREAHEEESEPYNVKSTPRMKLLLALSEGDARTTACVLAELRDCDALANPMPMRAAMLGVHEVWETVRRLIPSADETAIDSFFGAFISWLRAQATHQDVASILDALGASIARLSEEKARELGSIVGEKLRSEDKCEAILEKPCLAGARGADGESLKTFQRTAAESFMQPLMSHSALSPYQKEVLAKLHELRWPVGDLAEGLLSDKLKATMSNCESWAEIMSPLVGNRRVRLREAVLWCLEKNHNPECALAVGLGILWRIEIDAESAAAIGRFLTDNQSRIPSFQASWAQLRERKGVHSVLRVMRENLPEEPASLMSLGHALSLLEESFDAMEKPQKERLVDENLLPAAVSEDPVQSLQGLRHLAKLPAATGSAKKAVKQLQRDYTDDSEEAGLLAEIASKPNV